MKVYVQTDVGKVRPINEDSYYLPREGECFCAVADGMGGHNAGEVASAMAVDVFAGMLRRANTISGTTMRRAVEQANWEIHEKARWSDGYNGMGTTFTGLARHGHEVHIAHVGDSRAYLIRNGAIMRLTVDHTLVEEMVLKGLITPSEAKVHPKRNLITRALGTGAEVEVDLIQLELLPGDIFFLCSDGLSNHVSDQEILEITLKQDMSWPEKLRYEVDLAMKDGGTDNITAMYAIYEEGNK